MIKKAGENLKISIRAKLIYGPQAIFARNTTYNAHSKQDGIVQLYFIRNPERSSRIKFDFSLGNLSDNTYFFVWISHKTLYCCRAY
jgi:hypothetical protein